MIERFLAIIVASTVRDTDLRDAVAGDLLEEYEVRASSGGSSAATRWLLREVVTSLPHFMALSPHVSHDCQSLRFALRFYGSLAGLVAVSAGLWQSVELSGRMAHSGASAALALLVLALDGLVAGAVAAVITPRAPLLAALGAATMCAGIAAGSLLLSEHSASPWYIGASVPVLSSALVAGALARVRSTLSLPSGA